jgi:hypothetical protein
MAWVYNNLHKAEPRRAPSPGAAMLHRYARENTKDFFEKFLLKLLPTKGSDQRDEQDKPDATGGGLDLLDRWLAQHGVKEEVATPPVEGKDPSASPAVTGTV